MAGSMRVDSIPLLADNYAWLLVDESSRDSAVVDPSEAEPVLARVRLLGLRLRAILATHHHGDHTGGIAEILHAQPAVDVLCSDVERPRIASSTRGLADGERITIAGHDMQCLHVPGHTLGAAAFHFPAAAAVFTGDTLFTAGCGRLFEGTAEQMFASLSRLAALPPHTGVFCGHEYTLKNLRFAASLEPDNAVVTDRLARVVAARDKHQPTVPAPLSVELATNPFLRAGDPALARRVGGGAAVEVFAELRRRRDAF